MDAPHILIAKFLKGESTPLEREHLSQWIAESADNLAEFKRIETIWNAAQIVSNRKTFDSERAFAKFQQRIRLNTSTNKDREPVIRWLNILVRSAAAVLLLIGITAAIATIYSRTMQPSQLCEISTDYGSKTTFKLPDGSTIVLNSKSKISYPTRFNKKFREVSLEGEAYFEVTKDAKHPFIVKTNGINVRVLGTTFNVKAYPEEGTVETTLLTGHVKLEHTSSEGKTHVIDLKPQQRATFIKDKGTIHLSAQDEKQIIANTNQYKALNNPSQNVILINKVNPSVYVAWKDNMLVFDNESFESIAVKMERRYGVKITFESEEVKRIHFTGTFPDMPVEQSLKALQFASTFNYSMNKMNITISK